MKLNFSNEKDFLIMSISGEIDHRYAIQIRNEADRKIVTYPDKKLIVDLTDVTFMDSSAIGVIIGRYKLVMSLGGSIAIVSSNDTLARILDMSGIQKIIPIYPTLADAIR
jgi:stage II sporulation protein AA (anti-sigma F factor antagonist)